MKRLLLGPALALPLILGLCTFHTKVPELPKVPEVIREIPLDDFKQFPPIPVVPPVPVKKHQVKKHAPVVHPNRAPLRRPQTPVAPAPVEPLPPQQGPICIFPFNMIPNCTPQVAGQ